MATDSRAGTLHPVLFFGFALASIGGPLALVFLLLPAATGSETHPSIGLVTLLAIALFAFPLSIWWRFSRQIASAGGLFAFVEAAAGRTAARVHGVIWIVSYFLYLPYTITYVVYKLLPQIVPGVGPYKVALELVLPLAFVGAVLAPLRIALVPVLAVAGLQIGFLLVLGGLEIAHVGAPIRSFAPHGNLPDVGRGAGSASLLFICASLPLYLGGEVRGGARTVRLGLLAAVALACLYIVFAAFPLASVPAALRGADVPAYAIARAYGGHAFAVAAGLAAALSVLGLVFAEYAALGRLLYAMLGQPIRRSLLAIAVPFLIGDAVNLIDPQRFYEDALRPSLVALYLSQLSVFVVYPLFERARRTRLLAVSVGAAALAAAPMVYGLYLVLRNQVAS